MGNNVNIVDSNGQIVVANVSQREAFTLGAKYPHVDGYRWEHIGGVASEGSPVVGGQTVTREATERINGQIEVMRSIDVDAASAVASGVYATSRGEVKRTSILDKPLHRGSWSPHATAVPFGTRTIEDGDARLVEKREKWDAMPTAISVVDGMIERIMAEEREDIVVNLGDLDVDDDGGWYVKSNGAASGGLPITRQCWANLTGMLPKGAFVKGWTNADLAPVDVLQYNWRRQVAELPSDVLDKEVRWGVRTNGDEGDEGYRVVSRDGYSGDAMNALATLRQVRDWLGQHPEGATFKGKGFYDPDTTDVRVHLTQHADHVANLGAGDIFHAGLRIWTNDAKGGGLGCDLEALRNLCVNLLILANERFGRRSIAHRKGNEQGAAALLNAGFRDADKLMSSFLPQYRMLMDTPVSKVFGGRTTQEIMEEIAASRAMARLPVVRDTVVETLLLGFAQEPGTNLAAILNSVTRAHERVQLDVVPEWERAGGEVMKAMVASL